MFLSRLPGDNFSDIVYHVEEQDLVRLWLTGDRSLKWSQVSRVRFGAFSSAFASWPSFLRLPEVQPFEVYISPGSWASSTHWCGFDLAGLGNRVTTLNLEVRNKLHGFPAPLRFLFPQLEKLQLTNMGYVNPSDLANLPPSMTHLELINAVFGNEDTWKEDKRTTPWPSTIASKLLQNEQAWDATKLNRMTYLTNTDRLISGAYIDIILDTLPPALVHFVLRSQSLRLSERSATPEAHESLKPLINWPITLEYLEIQNNSYLPLHIFGIRPDPSTTEPYLESKTKPNPFPALRTLSLIENCAPSSIKFNTSSFWHDMPPALTDVEIVFIDGNAADDLPSVSQIQDLVWPAKLKRFVWDGAEPEEGWTAAMFDANPNLESCILNQDYTTLEANYKFSDLPSRVKTVYCQSEGTQDPKDLPLCVEELFSASFDESILGLDNPLIRQDYVAMYETNDEEEQSEEEDESSEEVFVLPEKPAKPAVLYPSLLPFNLKRLEFSDAHPVILMALPQTLTILNIGCSRLQPNPPPLPASITELTINSCSLPLVPGVGLKLLPAGLKALIFFGYYSLPLFMDSVYQLIELCPGPAGDPGIDETRRLPESLTHLDFGSILITKEVAQWVENLPSTMPLEFLRLAGYRSSELDCSWSLTIPAQLAHSTTLKTLELRLFRAYPSDFVFLPRQLRELIIYGHPCELKHLNAYYLPYFPKTLSLICFSFTTDTEPEDWIARGLPVPVLLK